jgi:hypothetical protein
MEAQSRARCLVVRGASDPLATVAGAGRLEADGPGREWRTSDAL